MRRTAVPKWRLLWLAVSIGIVIALTPILSPSAQDQFDRKRTFVKQPETPGPLPSPLPNPSTQPAQGAVAGFGEEIDPEPAQFTAGGAGVVIYKNFNAWFGENKDESVLIEDLGLIKGIGFDVLPMSTLADGNIPDGASLILITSASLGGTIGLAQIQQANTPAAQVALEAFVRGGGTLVVHLGDNVHGAGYIVPGLSGIADDALNCSGLTIVDPGHPVILGPNGVPDGGFVDDLNNSGTLPNGIDNGGRFCSDNHGSLAGILPADVTVVLREEGFQQRPVMATYPLGAGDVFVTTLTLEFGPHTRQTLINWLGAALQGNPSFRKAITDGPDVVFTPPPDEITFEI